MPDREPANTNAQSSHRAAAQQATTVVGLGVLNAGLHAQTTLLIESGVNATDIMNLLIEHVAATLAGVEEAAIRDAMIGEIQKNLPRVVARHAAKRMLAHGTVQ